MHPTHQTPDTMGPASEEAMWELPPGYAIGKMPNGNQYLVPHFLVSATDLALETYNRQKTRTIQQAAIGPLSNEDLPHGLIAAGSVMAPVVPGLSEHELLIIHAEVKALQEKYGLSYKDAAHRLYHSEVKTLQVEDSACKSMQDIVNYIDSSIVQDLRQRLKAIDDHVIENDDEIRTVM